MDSNTTEIAHDFPPFFRVYKDGRVERPYWITDFVPPSDDPKTGVRSKDVVVSTKPNVSARLYLPKSTTDHQKLPLLIYFHGGGFSLHSAFETLYHNYLNAVVATSHVIAVSVEYRLAPEHPVPASYEDSWTAIKWVALHANGKGPDPWVNHHADLGRVFLAGESAGANIAHNMTVRVSEEGHGSGVTILGMVLVHPFFGNGYPEELWMVVCPDSCGPDDTRLYPATNPSLMAKIGCKKVLVCIAERDELGGRGWSYYEALKNNSEWGGVVDVVETQGEDHCFHLYDLTTEKAGALVKLISSFLNQIL